MRQRFLAASDIPAPEGRRPPASRHSGANAGAGVEVTAIRVVRLGETHQGRYGTEVRPEEPLSVHPPRVFTAIL
jgi:hypothetical protein